MLKPLFKAVGGYPSLSASECMKWPLRRSQNGTALFVQILSKVIGFWSGLMASISQRILVLQRHLARSTHCEMASQALSSLGTCHLAMSLWSHSSLYVAP